MKHLKYLFWLLWLPVTAVQAQPTNAVASGTLAYYLSTNTAAYALGRAGDFGDMLEVRESGNTAPERVKSATWSQSFWLKNVRGLGATPVGFTTSRADKDCRRWFRRGIICVQRTCIRKVI